jgi:hypothetical protein
VYRLHFHTCKLEGVRLWILASGVELQQTVPLPQRSADDELITKVSIPNFCSALPKMHNLDAAFAAAKKQSISSKESQSPLQLSRTVACLSFGKIASIKATRAKVLPFLRASPKTFAAAIC